MLVTSVCIMILIHGCLAASRGASSARILMPLVSRRTRPSYNTVCMHSTRGYDIGGPSRGRKESTAVIVSPTNEKVKLLKSLQIKKKRDALGLVLLEGHRQIIDAIESGLKPHTLLMSGRANEAPLGRELLATLGSLGDRISTGAVSACSDALIESLSDTMQSQGVIAAFEKPIRPSLASFLSSSINDKAESHNAGDTPHKLLLLVLDGVSDPGNMGTLIRGAFGFGASACVVIEGSGSCDVWNPKVIRSSMGTCLRLPIFECDWGRYLADAAVCDSSPDGRLHTVLADCGDGAADYANEDEISYGDKHTALVIGSEAFGLSDTARALKGAMRITIPMVRDLESLNAAMAGTAILAEIARQRRRLIRTRS